MGIDDISEEAAKNIANHIRHCMDDKGESWIFQGLKYIRDKKCPFCSQNINENDLTQNFRLLFRESYKALKETINSKLSEHSETLSETVLRTIERQLNSNLLILDFWKDHVDLSVPDFSADEIDNSIRSLREEVIKLLLQKQNSPAEAVTENENLIQKFEAYELVKTKSKAYNEKIMASCVQIDDKKANTSAESLELKRNELNKLLCIQKRYEEEVLRFCEEYNCLQEQSNRLKAEKNSCRKQLDEYSEQILTAHEAGIRRHLEYFGAQFYPSQFQKDHSGGKPGFNFCIAINEVPIQLGNESTPETEPCFSNTLSEGDKQSLAFAFFLSKLEKDPNLHDKVVIFDDPICSLDLNRRTYTQQQIIRIAKMAKQVFLLSHDPYFLKLVSENFPGNITKLFKINTQNPQANTISLWNMSADTQSSYFRDFETLNCFLVGNETIDNRAVARCIRPLLEANLRVRFPDFFYENEWLGQFIEKIRNTSREDTDHPLAPMLTRLEELSAINDYSKKYHHDQNPGASTELISPTELRVYAQRTLNLIR